MIKRFLLMVLGVACLVFGVTISNRSGLGIDPFTAFCISLANHLPYSSGTMILSVNVLILLLVAVLKRQLIGPATVFMALFFGVIFDFYQQVLPANLFVSDQLSVRFLIFILGTVITVFGVAFYMESDLGFSAYDGLPFLVVNDEKAPMGKIRMMLDILVAIIAFILGGPINVGTVIAALVTGPMIDYFRKKVRPIYGRQPM